MAGRAERIAERVWLVGGEGLSAPGDCLCYALDLGALVLVDCGVGPGWARIRENLAAAGWYGTELAKVAVTQQIAVPEETLELPHGALHLLHAPGHTPGSLVAWIDLDEPRGATRILFGQDVHGPLHRDFGSDRTDWQRSLRRLIALDADVLCEGHHGVIRSRDEVRRFIEDFLED